MLKSLAPAVVCAALLAFAPVAAPADAQSRGGSPITGVARSTVMDFATIRARVDRQIGGRMIGSDYDAETFTYQLRYMRNGEIVDVVVDARTGRILGGRESM